jgi:hypothetical protein
MKFFDRWVSKRIVKIPWVREMISRLGDAIREARSISKDFGTDEAMKMEFELQLSGFRKRAQELIELRAAELACVSPEAYGAFAESHGPVQNAVQLKERLWELELALEDRGWVREVTLAALEFSRLGVQQLIKICRIYAIKNPLIKRTAEICMLYVFGRGFEVRSEDDTENDCIQDFLTLNDGVLGHVAAANLETSIQTDGTLYFGCLTQLDGTVKLIMVEPLEVMDIICRAEDKSVPRYFYRQWSQEDFDANTGTKSVTPKKVWYPSLEETMDPKAAKTIPKMMNGEPINKDMPILRVKVGSPRFWRWGLPPIYACIDWARAYKDFLEDWATVQRALARFALMVETKGGPGAIAAYNALFNTTFADAGGTQIERNPPPVMGSAHISGPGNQIQPFKTANAQTSPEQARRVLLMHCAGSGMPETFFGDASTGSLATAVSLDRPTELKFTEIQRRWTHTIKTLLEYALMCAKTSPGSKMKEAREANPAPQPSEIYIKFPNVIEHDILTMIQAIVDIGTGGGRNGIFAGIVDRRTIAEMLLAEIGYEKRGALLDKIYGSGKKKYDPADDVTDQRSQVPAQSIMQPQGKALTDLSTPPPLPPPPTPPAPIAPKPEAQEPPPKPGAPVPPKATVRPNGPAPKSKAAAEAKRTFQEAVDKLAART